SKAPSGAFRMTREKQAQLASGLECQSDVEPAGETARQGRENLRAPASELLLTKSRLSRIKIKNESARRKSETFAEHRF
ncbi:MAG: hypothetical protein KGI71_01930, partial [Patescibacteria group bacterium]|nr:hypothetical protein [Patescibacteria group bacterium]